MSLIGCHVVSLVFTLRLSTQLNCGPRPALNGAAPATPVAVTSLRQFSRGEKPANAYDARHATDTTGVLICLPIRMDLIRRANFLDSSNIAGSVFLGEDTDTNALPVHKRRFRKSDAVRPEVGPPSRNSLNCNSDAGTTPLSRTLRMENATHGYDSKSPRHNNANWVEPKYAAQTTQQLPTPSVGDAPGTRAHILETGKQTLRDIWRNKLNSQPSIPCLVRLGGQPRGCRELSVPFGQQEDTK